MGLCADAHAAGALDHKQLQHAYLQGFVNSVVTQLDSYEQTKTHKTGMQSLKEGIAPAACAPAAAAWRGPGRAAPAGRSAPPELRAAPNAIKLLS